MVRVLSIYDKLNMMKQGVGSTQGCKDFFQGAPTAHLSSLLKKFKGGGHTLLQGGYLPPVVTPLNVVTLFHHNSMVKQILKACSVIEGS